MYQDNQTTPGLQLAELIKTDPALQALHFIRLELNIMLSDTEGLSKDRIDALNHMYQIAGNAMKQAVNPHK